MKKFILLFIFLKINILSQGTWITTGITHPELKWKTLSSKNIKIHFHNGIEKIAQRGIEIAETILPSLLKQINLDTIGVIDITFTSEDEILNGFASFNNTIVIWVDQNDASLWLEDEKWLFQVVAHEMQHVVLMNAIKSWMPEPFGIFLSGTPSWFIEGSAEYFTERWRPYRSDIKHKYSFLRNEVFKMDPHDVGFSKLKYLAMRFGDSTIIAIIKNRNDLGMFFFNDAFKLKTGIPLEQFDEEWRRDMNTSYFGYRAQKERYEEIGKIFTLPVKKSSAASFANDSLKIAIQGKIDEWQFDESLIIATRDTLNEKNFLQKLFSSKKDSIKKEPVYKLKEVDVGEFHPFMNWSNDSKLLAYSKYHFDKNNSMTYDVKIYDTKNEELQWITSTIRATYPVFLPESEKLVFVSHNNSVANLILYEVKSKKIKQLTNFTKDTEILTPAVSPDGKQIAFALSEEKANVNIAIFNFSDSSIKILTKSPAAESKPVWSADGKSIIFTSHEGGALNLFTINFENDSVKQITDAGDGISSIQRAPKSDLIIANTLQDTDSIKFVLVDPKRKSKLTTLSLNPFYWDWKNKMPQVTLPTNFVEQKNMKTTDYSLLGETKILSWFVLPILYNDKLGVSSLLILSDPMLKNTLVFNANGTSGNSKNQDFYISYLNGNFLPVLSFTAAKNSTYRYRNYDQSLSGLSENIDILQFSGIITENRGEFMHSNHFLEFGFELQKRSVTDLYDTLVNNEPVFRKKTENKVLPIPEEADEEILFLQYRWVDRRNIKSMLWFPIEGKGVKLEARKGIKNIFGKFDYTKYSSDAFLNYPILKRLIFYGRIKFEMLEGKAPAQDYIGLTNDPPTYFPWHSQSLNTFMQYPENNSLRGWNGIRMGDRLVFGTVEFRLPITEQLPVNIFGINLGSVSISSVTDFGNAWFAKSELKQKVVFTSGYEVKMGINFGEVPLVNFAFGRAHPRHKPSEDKGYLRLSLINPF